MQHAGGSDRQAGDCDPSPAAPCVSFTVEKLVSLQSLQISVARPAGGALAQSLQQPRCAIDNTFTYKPILRIQTGEASASPGGVPTAAPPTLSIPLPSRVDLADSRTAVTQREDCTIFSIRIKQGQ